MHLFRHYASLPAEIYGGVVALGNFDGVHLGHQAVIKAAKDIGQVLTLPVGVMTFEPHPRTVLTKDRKPFRLTPFRIKVRTIEALGVDFLVIQRFDSNFSSYTATEFIDYVLVAGIRARHVVIGYDYSFGHNRSGNSELLSLIGNRRGFDVTTIAPVCSSDGMVHSSTQVRTCLTEGKPRDAARLLGRYFEIEGRVEYGDSRGRRLGYPTANLDLGEYQRPRTGVYAVRAGIRRDGKISWWGGVANYGYRPSFDTKQFNPIFEVHIFDFSEEIYRCYLRVALVEFLRSEQHFSSLETLQLQIATDSERALTILQHSAASI